MSPNNNRPPVTLRQEQTERARRVLNLFLSRPANEQENLLQNLLLKNEAGFLILEASLNREALLRKQRQDRLEAEVLRLKTDFFEGLDDSTDSMALLYKHLHKKLHDLLAFSCCQDSLLDTFEVTASVAIAVNDEIFKRYEQSPYGTIYDFAFQTLRDLYAEASQTEKKHMEDFILRQLADYARDSTTFEALERFLIVPCHHQETAQALVTHFEAHLPEYLNDVDEIYENYPGEDWNMTGETVAWAIRAMKVIRLPATTINAYKKQFNRLFPVVALDVNVALEKQNWTRAMTLLAGLLKRIPRRSQTARTVLHHLMQLERYTEDFDNLSLHGMMLWNAFREDFITGEPPSLQECMTVAEQSPIWELSNKPVFKEPSNSLILNVLALDEHYVKFLQTIEEYLKQKDFHNYKGLIDTFSQYFVELHDEEPSLTQSVGQKLFIQALLDPTQHDCYWQYAHALRLLIKEEVSFVQLVCQAILDNPKVSKVHMSPTFRTGFSNFRTGIEGQ